MKLSNIIRKRCPKCQSGELFGGWFRMNVCCGKCGMNFYREQGYYTGAMFINWFFAVFLIAPVWVVLLYLEVPFWMTMTVTLLLLVICAPLFFQYSRTIWLYIDYTFFHAE